MTINSVALIAGALGFSAALAWNKAISDMLVSVFNTNSSIIQAVVITISIMLVVFLINTGLDIYTHYTNVKLKPSIINSGGGEDSKVKLFNSTNI